MKLVGVAGSEADDRCIGVYTAQDRVIVQTVSEEGGAAVGLSPAEAEDLQRHVNGAVEAVKEWDG